MDVIKVSSKSISQKVAGSIANSFREGSKQVEIQTVGAGAVNQAIKAIAIARGFVAPSGKNLVCIPAFQDIDIEAIFKPITIKTFNPKICKINFTSAASEIKIGNISSEVDKKIAINVPNDTTLPAYRLAAEAEKPH